VLLEQQVLVVLLRLRELVLVVPRVSQVVKARGRFIALLRLQAQRLKKK
jgi:hypothetical protein